jgi:hypothetical protein
MRHSNRASIKQRPTLKKQDEQYPDDSKPATTGKTGRIEASQRRTVHSDTTSSNNPGTSKNDELDGQTNVPRNAGIYLQSTRPPAEEGSSSKSTSSGVITSQRYSRSGNNAEVTVKMDIPGPHSAFKPTSKLRGNRHDLGLPHKSNVGVSKTNSSQEGSVSVGTSNIDKRTRFYEKVNKLSVEQKHELGRRTFSGETITDTEIFDLYNILTMSGKDVISSQWKESSVRSSNLREMPSTLGFLDFLGGKVPTTLDAQWELMQRVITLFDNHLLTTSPGYESFQVTLRDVPTHLLHGLPFLGNYINLKIPFSSQTRYVPSFKIGHVLRSFADVKQTTPLIEEKRYFNVLLTQVYGQIRHQQLFQHVLGLLFSDGQTPELMMEKIDGFHDDAQVRETHLCFHSLAIRTLLAILMTFKRKPFKETDSGVEYDEGYYNSSSVLLKIMYQLLNVGRMYLHGEINGPIEAMKVSIIFRCSMQPDDMILDNKDDYLAYGEYLMSLYPSFPYMEYRSGDLSPGMEVENVRSEYDDWISSQLRDKLSKTALPLAYNHVMQWEQRLKSASPTDVTLKFNYLATCAAMSTLPILGDYIKGSTTTEFVKSAVFTAKPHLLTPITNLGMGGDVLFPDETKMNYITHKLWTKMLDYKRQGIRMLIDKYGDDYFQRMEQMLIKDLTNKGSGKKKEKNSQDLASTKRTLEFIDQSDKYYDWQSLQRLIMETTTKSGYRFQLLRRVRLVIAFYTPSQVPRYIKKVVEESEYQLYDHSASKSNRGNAIDSAFLFNATTESGTVVDSVDIAGMDTSIQPTLYSYALLAAAVALQLEGVKCNQYFWATPTIMTVSPNKREDVVNPLTLCLLKSLSPDAAAPRFVEDYVWSHLGKPQLEIPTLVFPTGAFDTSSNHTALMITIIQCAIDELDQVRQRYSGQQLKDELELWTPKEPSLQKLQLQDLNTHHLVDHRNQGDDIVTVVRSSNVWWAHYVTRFIHSYMSKFGFKLIPSTSRYYGTFLQRTILRGHELPKSGRIPPFTAERSNLELDWSDRWASYLMHLRYVSSRSCFNVRLIQFGWAAFFFNRYITVSDTSVQSSGLHPHLRDYYRNFEGVFVKVLAPMAYLIYGQFFPNIRLYGQYDSLLMSTSMAAPASRLTMSYVLTMYDKSHGKDFHAGSLDFEALRSDGWYMANFLAMHAPKLSDIRIGQVEDTELVRYVSKANKLFGLRDRFPAYMAGKRISNFLGLELPKSVSALYAPENVVLDSITAEKQKDELKSLDNKLVLELENYKPYIDLSSWMCFTRLVKPKNQPGMESLSEFPPNPLFIPYRRNPLKALVSEHGEMMYHWLYSGPPRPTVSTASQLNRIFEINSMKGINSKRLSEMVVALWKKYMSDVMITDLLVAAGIQPRGTIQTLEKLHLAQVSNEEIIYDHVQNHGGQYYVSVSPDVDAYYYVVDFKRFRRIKALYDVVAGYYLQAFPWQTSKVEISIPLRILNEVYRVWYAPTSYLSSHYVSDNDYNDGGDKFDGVVIRDQYASSRTSSNLDYVNLSTALKSDKISSFDRVSSLLQKAVMNHLERS